MEGIIPKVQELFTVFGLKIIAAVLIFIIGRWVAKLVKRIVERLMTRSNIDATVINFVGNMTYILYWPLLSSQLLVSSAHRPRP
jgi:small conductance mechanosensitive channel